MLLLCLFAAREEDWRELQTGTELVHFSVPIVRYPHWLSELSRMPKVGEGGFSLVAQINTVRVEKTVSLVVEAMGAGHGNNRFGQCIFQSNDA